MGNHARSIGYLAIDHLVPPLKNHPLLQFNQRISMPLLRSRTLTLFATIVLALCVPAQAQIKEVEAYAGRPFGVGRITLEARPAADGLDSLTAAGFRLVDADDRTFYPAVEVAKVGEFLRNFLKLRGPQKVNVYFLFQGDAPLRVKCYTPSPMTAEIRPRISAEGHRELLEDWWEEYTGNLRDLGSGGEYPVVVHNYVASMLANRLGLDPREIGNYGERNPLEQTIGLMLGTESIRAAMARDVLLSDAEDPSPVSEPLPEPVAPPPVEYPAVDPEVEVESIASHVPQECFYVRFGDFRNYLWLRDLMSRWGGGLENMISRRGIDYRVTSKIERQLSLKESKLARVLGPAVISDCTKPGQISPTVMKSGISSRRASVSPRTACLVAM